MTTFAPQALRDLRAYMKQQTGLPDKDLGIVGDKNHNGGYHHGWSQRRTSGSGDYSWTQSPRDSAQPRTEAASAFDIGMFPRLRELSLWLVDQCVRKAPDTLDIREVIYSPDGKVVRRWDRLGKSSTGDNSHLTHTHISFFRDAQHRAKTSVFERFFGEDMATPQEIARAVWDFVPDYPGTDQTNPNQYPAGQIAIGTNQGVWVTKGEVDALARKIDDLESSGLTPAQIDLITDALVRKLKAEMGRGTWQVG